MKFGATIAAANYPVDEMKTRLAWHNFIHMPAKYIDVSWFSKGDYDNLCGQLKSVPESAHGLSRYISDLLSLPKAPQKISVDTVRLSLILVEKWSDSLCQLALMILAFPFSNEISGPKKQLFVEALGEEKFKFIQPYINDPFIERFYLWIPYQSINSIDLSQLDSFLSEMARKVWQILKNLLDPSIIQRILLAQPITVTEYLASQRSMTWTTEDDLMVPDMIRWIADQLDVEEKLL